ncbi:MAG TPA: AMP-binding protein [Chthoniobacterales bacterium]
MEKRVPPFPWSLELIRWVLSRFVYRVKTLGVENLPSQGPVLLVPNHMTYVDAVVLQLACPRPVRFLVFKGIYEIKWLNPIFKWVRAIPISGARAKEAIESAVERLREGEVVCIFPEGELTRSGSLLKLKKGFELIARKADCPVVPVWLDRLWGSIFSFKGGKFFKKFPKRIPYPCLVAFDHPLPPEKADVAVVRERLQILGERAYQERPELRGHLAAACIGGLRKHRRDVSIIDGMDHTSLTRGTLLAAGIALSRYIKREIPAKRVAVILPSSKGAVVANLATVLADKVPVNLNLTAGRSALQSAIDRGDIDTAFSAALVRKRFKEIPWPKKTLNLEEVMPHLKPHIIAWRVLIEILPTWFLCWALGIPKTGDRKEAVLLFTSGSSGEPKGVVLSHRNLLGNVGQFTSMVSLGRGAGILASLPFFHSFGCTVTLWFPIIEGYRAITCVSPLDIGKSIELIERYNVVFVCSTPTFLRGYLRKATPEQIKSIRLLVTGAEKLPNELALHFEKTLGIPVMQGYGLTETSPVVSTNLPDPLPSRPNDTVQPSNRLGSVGKLVAGQAVRITDPDTDEPLSIHETGMLWLKGPNIFEGYLHDPEKTAGVLKDGWFRTGDLGRMDEDGFLYIEGRLSRFSKIGGEMVPHETVESAIGEVMSIDPSGERRIAIGSIPDESKGEALVLLTTVPIDSTELRKKLNDMGIPNLWVPKIISQVETIPVLATGKLDLAGVKALADAAIRTG